MTRLILTTSDSGAGSLREAGIADIVIPFDFRFVWGPLPSEAALATAVAPRSSEQDQTIDHWLWNVHRKHLGETGSNEIGLIDLCKRCETIELWIDPAPPPFPGCSAAGSDALLIGGPCCLPRK